MSRILSAACAAMLLSCATAKPNPGGEAGVTAGEQRLDEREQRLSGLSALLTVPLTNSGVAPVRVSSARFEVVLDGKVVNRGELPLSTEIAAGAESSVEVPAELEYAQSAEELQALADRKAPLSYAVRGVLAVGSQEIEFARASEVRPPHLPTVSMDSVEVLFGSESGLTVSAGLMVENPNPFAVTLQGLRWKLLLGGKPLGEDTVGRGEVLKAASHVRFEVSVALDPGEVKERGLPSSGSVAYEVSGQLEAAPALVEMKQAGQAKILSAGE